VRCQYSTAEDGRQPAPKSYVVMLRNRIQLLERVLHAHGIDADASIAQLSAKSNSPGQPPDSGGTAASNVDELCLTFDGALTLDESLNFDQDGEVRYFGPSSGRLLFRSPGNGKLTLMNVGEKYADHLQIHLAKKHAKLMPIARDITPRIQSPQRCQC
jgi:hypothetical protein